VRWLGLGWWYGCWHGEHRFMSGALFRLSALLKK
jgi:hypothetical protein